MPSLVWALNQALFGVGLVDQYELAWRNESERDRCLDRHADGPTERWMDRHRDRGIEMGAGGGY